MKVGTESSADIALHSRDTALVYAAAVAALAGGALIAVITGRRHEAAVAAIAVAPPRGRARSRRACPGMSPTR